MNNIVDLKKAVDETELQYIWRLGSAKDSGTLDITWPNLTELFNKELRDETETWTESAYRKKFQMAKAFYDEVFSKMIDEQYSKEVQVQLDELYKIKKQVSDQRRLKNRDLTLESRFDHLCTEMLEVAKDLNKLKPLKVNKEICFSSGREAVIYISDLHYGLVTDNIWNTYNIDICENRLEKLIDKTKQHLIENGVYKLHLVILGDLCHGSIHTGCRVDSEEETCMQLMHVTERMAEIISALADCVTETSVYSTYGNHMRTIQNKKDSKHSDNMERLVPWWLKERLRERNDVTIVPADWYEFIKLNVCGVNIVCTHGDLENFKDFGVTMNTIFTKKFGETIDLTVMGDKHHLEEFERLGIESVIVRSLCGSESYANEKRLYSSAGQTLMLFNQEDGREATYNIILN
ncbi:metallophosphoesterase [Lacrimispora sphenoides]|uniref:metallophosphoesterase n=1 Tax=Lacrimispora sphenoides TaxID=29370 RepID=UPI000B8491C0|nr:metallophosphoesterase [Lacrimispora sphenoides]